MNIRAILRVSAIVVGLLACLPLHYSWKLFGQPSPWPRRFLFWVGYSAGVRTRIVGAPLARRVLFLSNHLSWLDIMVIAGATGAAFVSKDEVGRWPVIGWLARLNNTVFVARTERKAVHGQAEELRSALSTGQPVALFPEGTTAGGTEVLPFRASLLASLFPPLPGIKVQPVALEYHPGGEDIAWVGEESAKANARRVFARKGRVPVTVHFLAPIDPADAADRKVLAQRSRDSIVEALTGSGRAPDRL